MPLLKGSLRPEPGCWPGITTDLGVLRQLLRGLSQAVLSSDRTLLGAAYTIEPNPRTPEEVLESLFGAKDEKSSEETAKARPKPLYKHIRASMHRDEADTLGPARNEIGCWLAKEYRQRNPCAEHRQILIMDGEDKLWAMGQELQLDAPIIEILDLLHASSYVWKAVQALYPQRTTNEQIPLVKERIGRLLHGEVQSVICTEPDEPLPRIC